MRTIVAFQRCRVRISLLSLVLLFVSFCCPNGAGAEQRELLIGVEPEHNIFDQVQHYRTLAAYLSEHLDIEVKLTIMSRYGELVNRFKSLHLDGAILNSFTATLAINNLGLTPVGNIVNLSGEATSRGFIFVRKDSGIKSVEGMKGKRVVFVDPATTEGFVFAKAYFRQQGVEDLDSYFSKYYFSGSHASAVFAVLDGRADIGSAKGSVFSELVKKDRSIQAELEILAKSPVVPGVTLCLKNDIDPALLKKLQAALLNMNQSAEGYKVLKEMEAKRFVRSSPDEFNIVLQLAEEAGVKMLQE